MLSFHPAEIHSSSSSLLLLIISRKGGNHFPLTLLKAKIQFLYYIKIDLVPHVNPPPNKWQEETEQNQAQRGLYVIVKMQEKTEQQVSVQP